ncbi:MAG: ThiF family adenylyltransferase [Myxococcales bacterium]|nr:ThiF family adenylyltransferase [Myxococcales bacterium]
MRVVVVGVGALGSHVVQLGRTLPVQWRVIDFDRIEAKNLLAQFHTRMGVGKNKAQALQQAMQGLFGVKIDAVPHRLTADNTEALLGDAALVVDCLDNAEARTLVQQFVRAREIACVHGALAPDGELGRVVWDHLFAIDSEDTPGQETCEGGEHLAFIARTAATLAQAIALYVRDRCRVSTQLMPSGSIVLDTLDPDS